jgi:hypothetical protein
MIKFLGLALVISASSPMIAHAKAAKAASLQSISEKYGGSSLEKRMLLRDCREANIESLADVCSKKAADLSSADVDRIKEGLASNSEQASSSPVVEEQEMVSSSQANINVASGNGIQQSTSTSVTTGMDCITRATQNTNRVVASLNARMAGRFANKK